MEVLLWIGNAALWILWAFATFCIGGGLALGLYLFVLWLFDYSK